MSSRKLNPPYAPLIRTIPLPYLPGDEDHDPTTHIDSDSYSSSPRSPSSESTYSPVANPMHSHLGLYIPSPTTSVGVSVRIHPLLAVGSILDWDLGCDPRSNPARVHSGGWGEWTHLQPHVLLEPATSPPVASLTITCDDLPWSISVAPLVSYSSWPRPSYLTTSDVLSVMHVTLRNRVSPAEFNTLSDSEKSHVGYALGQSSNICGVQRRAMKAPIMRRIDWLLGKTRFEGLEQRSIDGSKWALRVRRCS
ncbi:hypothetical protein JAAARDRAFT_405264 [Jaapia argillacea MUCL 33604]|uniref:DUF6699 domain-containing protein n=1 Tax=Jaapia argillacea MUCL 33604 TaxID=933084 RepID=A0A067PVG5_9AGAM|nr:hypothetical protein JAAARDRAFT_405264 [Jaapia argillacea MUCL 33604]